MRIKGLLGIVADNYHPKGVGENDILIIATALVYRVELVTEEQRQPNAPQVLAKRKIPLVWGMPSVAVPCYSFIDYINGPMRSSGSILFVVLAYLAVPSAETDCDYLGQS